MVGISGKELRIFQVERLLGETFTQRVLKTKYTPTRMQVNPRTGHLIVVERDYNCYTETQRSIIRQRIFEETKSEEYRQLDFNTVGYPRPGALQEAPGDARHFNAGFASCLRIIDPVTMETEWLQEFENNETCFSVYVSKGQIGLPNQTYMFLGIGIAASLTRTC